MKKCDINKNNNAIEIEEIKRIQLNILKYVHNFCRENNIKYWIDFGTLLGAVRHKGYIPWDDDIDISMLKDDYEKFMRLFNNNNSKYKFSCYENDTNSNIPYGKIFDTNTILYEPNSIHGKKSSVFIDIFVYYKIPNDSNIAKKTYERYIKNIKLNNLQCNKYFYDNNKRKYNFIRYPIYLLLQIFPKRYFVKKNIELCNRFSNYDTDYVMVCGKLINKKIFDSLIEIDFEGEKFMAPKEYDYLLKNIFGDYMKLPPIEKRISNHKFEAYLKEDKNERND